MNTAYNSFNNVPGRMQSIRSNDPNAQYGGSWISTVPSTYTPQDEVRCRNRHNTRSEMAFNRRLGCIRCKA